MAVKAINTPVNNNAILRQRQKDSEQKQNNNQPSFQGMGNPVVMLMDAIERGGFAASFIAQDGIGMVAPRIREGLNRGREKDENGNFHGPLNWAFARKEGIREILSGPSTFLIPLGMLTLIKKYSGTANNVSADVIKSLGQQFEEYASQNSSTLSDVAKTKKEYYNGVFRKVLNTTLDGKLGDELSSKADEFTSRAIEIENSKSKGFFKTLLDIKVDGSEEDLTQKLADDFMMLKKQYLDPSVNAVEAKLPIEGRKDPVSLSFKKLIESMKDYSDDAISSVNEHLNKNSAANAAEFINNHTSRRIGSRFLTIMSMFGAVVCFFTVIPKIYNMGLKGNPALKNQNVAQNNTTEKAENQIPENNKKGKNVAFQGAGIQKAMKKTGDAVMNNSWLKKLSDKFDFDGASMSVPAMLTLLFGFCLPPRYFQAQDEYDKKEILVRDISSFTAILFGAKALSRTCSVAFSKLSGLALNTKPADHEKSFLHKLKNYFTAGSGINVLSSEAIVSKYTNIDKYPGGINGFFEFIEKNDGNIKKVLGLDKNVKANAEAIIGKPLKNASIDEIKAAFKNVKDTKALENIYDVFRNVKGNKYVNYAKTMNSAFGALSTLALVPAFMIWLARYCDKMTKKHIARDNAAAQTQQSQQTQPPAEQSTQIKAAEETKIAQPVKDYRMQRPTMAGFIK